MRMIGRNVVGVFGLLALAGAAWAGGSSGAGLLVLNTTADGALSMTGNSSIRVPAATVYVNSSSRRAVQTVGNATLDTPSLYIVGTPSFGGNSGCTGAVHVSAVPFADPMSGYAVPSMNGVPNRGAATFNSNTTAVLQPGHYPQGIRVTGNANLTLEPGVYFVENSLTITSGNIVGDGVTIVVISGSLNIAGTSGLHLTPPANGPNADMVMVMAPGNVNGLSLAGGSAMQITGCIYAPRSLVTLTGNSTLAGQGPLMGDLVIADTVRLTGTAEIRIGQTASPPINLPSLPLFD